MINLSKPPIFLVIGQQGENLYRPIEFDVADWLTQFPDGEVSIVFERPDGEKYPVVVGAVSSPVIWTPSATDTAVSGYGKLELRISSGDVLGKSVVIQTTTAPSINGDGTAPPTPAPDWMQEVADNAASAQSDAGRAETARDRAEAAAIRQPVIGDNSNWWVWDIDTGVYADTGLAAPGPKGDTGNGVATIERTGGTGAPGTTDTYTITYTSGATTTFPVYNGANGRGIASVIRTAGDGSPGTTDTYTINFTDGTSTDFSVYNGADGELMIEDIVDDLTTGGVDKALSAEQGKVLGQSISELTKQTSLMKNKNLFNMLNRLPVSYGSYLTPPTTASNWGQNSASSERHFLSNENRLRVRQNGSAHKVSIYTNILTGTSNLYIEFWRKSSTTWDLVYREDIINKVAANAFNTVILNQPVQLLEGDFIGYGVKTDAGGYMQFTAFTGGIAKSTYYTNSAITDVDFNWAAQTASTSYMPIVVYGEAPTLIAIGDSKIAGHPANYTFIESSTTGAPTGTIAYNIFTVLGWTYQNMGMGSQTSTSIAARFAADVVALRPRIVLMEAGVNDIAGGVITQATYVSNMKAMLDACASAGILPIVIKILPWTNGTTQQMQTRDTWNDALETLALGYDGAIIVDASTNVGLNRVGGDEGNLWNINDIYDSGDGVHYNAAGYAKIAEAVVDAVTAAWS